MALKFHNAMLEPSDEERSGLDAAHAAWLAAREGDSNDSEHEAAADLIDALMGFAQISDDGEPETEACTECGEPVDPLDGNPRDGMCGPCVHDAERSGWEG